jgi:hypothetical protein
MSNTPSRSGKRRSKAAASPGTKLPAASAVAATDPAVPAVAPAGETTPASSLTPDEQMARFAKELQENDWGHQPC